MVTEAEERIEQIVRSAIQRRAEDRDDEDCSDCWWKLSRGYRKALIPVACIALGSLLTFAINVKTSSATQGAELQSQAKLVDDLKSHMVSREVFDATIQPMASDIADIKKSMEDLHKLQKQDSEQKVIYRTYKLTAAAN